MLVLQEQYDQLQRQLQHITTREAGLQAEVDAYKLEHTQLLAANTQLMAQCTSLNKEVQVRTNLAPYDPCSWHAHASS
jgi:uncharacterized protein (DUF3084 family)